MSTNIKKLIGITLIMAGILLAGFVLVRALFYAPDTDLAPPNATSTAGSITSSTSEALAPSRFPSRLSIASIGVDAAVQYVGVKTSGIMANPNNFTDVGWYKDGPVPGAIGSAVMAGHVDNALALDGVFKELSVLAQGDEVVVTRKDGVKLTFRVDKLEYYNYKEAPNEKIFLSSDGKAHLNLVTCAGNWIKSEKSYSERLVVYTTLVE